MLANPDHKVIKALAKELLFKMTECPDGLQKVCNELLPLARFENGMTKPNKHRPVAVYVELEGVTWRTDRAHKSWRKV